MVKSMVFMLIWGLLHKTLTGEKTLVKFENSGKPYSTTDFTPGGGGGGGGN